MNVYWPAVIQLVMLFAMLVSAFGAGVCAVKWWDCRD